MNKPLKLADACQLTDKLWVGGELDQADRNTAQRQLDELIAAGVTAIVDTRYEGDDIDWVTDASPTIDYLQIGVKDAGQRMPAEWFDDGTEYALQQIKQRQVVLAHCQAGINRGPSMAFAILIASGWDTIDALKHIQSVRPIARILYAEDAVQWWFSKVGAPDHDQRMQVNRVRDWRAEERLPRRSNGVG